MEESIRAAMAASSSEEALRLVADSALRREACETDWMLSLMARAALAASAMLAETLVAPLAASPALRAMSEVPLDTSLMAWAIRAA